MFITYHSWNDSIIHYLSSDPWRIIFPFEAYYSRTVSIVILLTNYNFYFILFLFNVDDFMHQLACIDPFVILVKRLSVIYPFWVGFYFYKFWPALIHTHPAI